MVRRQILRIVPTLLLVLTVASCTTVYRNHGFVPSDEDLSGVIVGVDTRASVEEVLGLPTTGGVTNTAGYYYISSRWRHFAYTRPRPVERQIVAVAFDADGVVQNISRYGLENGKVVTLSRRVTDGGTKEISFIRQLMGNFGNFDAGQVFGEG